MRSALLALFLCGVPLLTGCPNDTPNNPAKTPAAGAALSGTVYWAGGSFFDIHKLDLGTGDDQALGFGHAVNRAPDGKLVIIGKKGLEESDDTLVATRVIKASDPAGLDPSSVDFVAPQVSPDGTKIAYGTLLHSSYVCARADGSVLAKFVATA